MLVARWIRSAMLILLGLVLGIVMGGICVKVRDGRKERMNYFGRQCLESVILMSDIDALKDQPQKLDASLNSRLDSSALIISQFINDNRVGDIARSRLSQIDEFREKNHKRSTQ